MNHRKIYTWKIEDYQKKKNKKRKREKKNLLLEF